MFHVILTKDCCFVLMTILNEIHLLQVLLEIYCVKVVLFWQFNIKDKVNIFYRLITSKVRYLKHFFVVILLIMIYSLLKPQTQKLRNLNTVKSFSIVGSKCHILIR